MATLMLSHSEVIASTDVDVLSRELGEALARYRPARSEQRARAPVDESLTAMILFPGREPLVPGYTVKAHAKIPGGAGIKGVILLHDDTSGELLAVMDSPWLTAQRTALSAAFVHVVSPTRVHPRQSLARDAKARQSSRRFSGRLAGA